MRRENLREEGGRGRKRIEQGRAMETKSSI